MPPLITTGLVVFILFSTFTFASTENWSAAACEAFLFLLAAVAYWRNRHFTLWPKALRGPQLAVLVLLIVGALQLVPLPAAFWGSFGDERATLQQDAAKAETLLRSEGYRRHPFLPSTIPADAEPPQAAPPASWIPATFTPLLTLRALLALSAFGCLVALLGLLAEEGDALKTLAWTVGLAGLLTGLIAMAQFRPGVKLVMGFRQSQFAAGAFGPFINQNNGVGFVNIAMCLMYYMLWRKFLKTRHSSNRMGLAALLGVLGLFHFSVLLIRTSEAGWWTLLMFPLVLLLRMRKNSMRWQTGIVVALVACAIVFAGVAVACDFTDLHFRIPVWQNALGQGHWLIGNGLNGFSERFTSVLKELPLLRFPIVFLYPENEYLQLFFEAGVAGLLVGLGALGYIAFLGFAAIRSTSAAFLLVPALWGEAVHAVTDFPFHIIPCAAAYLIAVAIVASSINRSGRFPGNDAIKTRSPGVGS